jgi:hemerythrin HHE cation binding domain-containing protein
MKRDPALTSLSRDHHQALVVAQKLRRATSGTAGQSRAALLRYWEAHGRLHFRLEEEVLLPAYAGHGDPHHPLLARALCDHVAIRHAVDKQAGRPAIRVAELHQLGGLLGDHIRLEERQLFPLIERAIPAAQLAALAAHLEQAERRRASQAAPSR